MIGYNKSTVVFISQLKGAEHPLVLTNQGLQTPPVFISHNLNHVSAFFYSCFVLPRLALAYLSLHLTPLVLLTYQHPWSVRTKGCTAPFNWLINTTVLLI